MDRYICIHGHFYQPPRENPWLETVEVQDSAYPYHDWNERITAECYEPNASSRILDGDGRIVRIVNNYSSISFNFGPTLLSWLEMHSPETYRLIQEADRASLKRFGGHGSALAQVYNHMIMPLANQRDKYTQVYWGIRDFQHRFGRFPEGMWLAETAVDTDTLEVLADCGIKFTVLAPNQAYQMRSFRGRTWHDVGGSRIDPTMPYEVRLPSRRRIAVFFYDGPVSRAVAFEGLLLRGEYLADRLMGAFSDQRSWPQLVHIATDGESYGHHHSHGDMALAYALHHITTHKLARLTNYGEHLERHPQLDEVKIFDNSSWSCVHGIERWRSDCGCNSGGHLGWNQQWRRPLREALDWLRDALRARFEEMGRRMFKDPWAARNDYINVVLDRSSESIEKLFARQAAHRLGEAVTSNALMLLEMQRQCMLMYTSCGWFFDELSGIETVQILAYAGRAVQLAEYLFEEEFEQEFLRRLALARSNLPEHQDAKRIYEKFVKPAKVELTDVGAHFAVSSLFQEYKQRNKLFCYTTEVGDYQISETGHARMVVGNATVRSDITWQKNKLSFGVIHWGGHNLHGGVRPYEDEERYRSFVKQAAKAFQSADFPMLVRQFDQEFQASTYSLRSLFRDEQRKILNIIVDSGPAERSFRELYHESAPLASFLTGLGAPIPKPFRMAAEFILNLDLRRSLEESAAPDQIRSLLDKTRAWGIELDSGGLSYALNRRIRRTAHRLSAKAPDLSLLEEVETLADVAHLLPFEVNLRPVQNVYYDMLQTVYPQLCQKAAQNDKQAASWVGRFRKLGEKLVVRVAECQSLIQGASTAAGLP